MRFAGSANVVCVAATGSTDQLSAFSDFGMAHVDLAAPGEGIVSTVPPGVIPGCGTSLYCSLDGTSMAAPMVSGAAALAVAAQPALSVAALRSLIVSAVDPEANLSGQGRQRRSPRRLQGDPRVRAAEPGPDHPGPAAHGADVGPGLRGARSGDGLAGPRRTRTATRAR